MAGALTAVLCPPRAVQRADVGLLRPRVRAESRHGVHGQHGVLGDSRNSSLGIHQAHSHLPHLGQLTPVNHLTAAPPSELSRKEGEGAQGTCSRASHCWENHPGGFHTLRTRDTITSEMQWLSKPDKCHHASSSSAPSHGGARPGAPGDRAHPADSPLYPHAADTCSHRTLAKNTKANACISSTRSVRIEGLWNMVFHLTLAF